jgi:OTU domain-containing protein 3
MGRGKNKSKSKQNKQNTRGGGGGGGGAAAQHKADRRYKQERRKKHQCKKQQQRGKGDLDTYSRAFRKYTAQVARLGLFIRDMKGDGNCMFRSVADQLYSQEHRHAEVRGALCDFVEAHRQDFEPFVEDDEDFDVYLARMRGDAEWGGNFELAAVVRCFGVHVIVHQLAAPRYQLTNHERSSSRTIHVSYHDGEHYNSVRVLGDVAYDGPAREIPKKLKLNVEGSGPRSGKESPNDALVVSRATGCSEDAAVEVLADCDGDVDAAIEVLVAMSNVQDAEDGEDADHAHAKESEDEEEEAGSSACAAATGAGWESAAFTPKPKKRVTRKERKAEAKRLREAKRAAQLASAVAEEGEKRQRNTKQKKKKKLTKREKREEQRRAAARVDEDEEERGRDGGDRCRGGLEDDLTTLAI